MMSPIELAVELLKKGELIALPTETVYALAGDARNLSAVRQIFKLKNRPLHQPLSVLLAEDYIFEAWACDISPLARQLAHHFWPGPLTLIVRKHPSILSELTAGQENIGLRVPDHPVTQAILKAFNGGLAAPSANRSAHLSPTQAEHVHQEWGDQVDLIVDGGACSIGIESTVIDVTATIPRILRLGAISVEQIQRAIHSEVIEDFVTRSVLQTSIQPIMTEQLSCTVSESLEQGKTVTVLGLSTPSVHHPHLHWIAMPHKANEYGQVLYQSLHKAERCLSDQIFIECVPREAAWVGIELVLTRLIGIRGS